MNIRPEEAELLHADRRTDMTKLMVFFAILRKPLDAEKYKMFDQSVTWVCSNV